jgi:hypothetical protein
MIPPKDTNVLTLILTGSVRNLRKIPLNLTSLRKTITQESCITRTTVITVKRKDRYLGSGGLKAAKKGKNVVRAVRFGKTERLTAGNERREVPSAIGKGVDRFITGVSGPPFRQPTRQCTPSPTEWARQYSYAVARLERLLVNFGDKKPKEKIRAFKRYFS